jgi:hypothetical protein
MNKITFPLNRRVQGPQVADLHIALQALLDRALLLPNDEAARGELAAALRGELERQSFGEATGKLVSVFQRERHLQPSGEVDGPTADALNKLLHEMGLLDQGRPPAFRLVTGVVRREDGVPLQSPRMRAAHVSDHREIRLGDDSADAEGRYTIRYEALPGVDVVNLMVSVIGEDGRTIAASALVPNAKPVETIDLTVPITAPAADHQTIEGAILLEHGQPAEKLKLRLYRRDFGGKATLLGETTTVGAGRYAFSYDAGGRAASLEVRAVKPDGTEVPLTKPLNDLTAESRANLNMLAPGSLQPLAAEYGRLSADLTSHVGSMSKLKDAREDAKQQDLSVLNRATGWDARLIALAAISERLAADPDVGLPSEALYGLLRAGLPSDKLLLAQVEPDVVDMALKKVCDAGVVEMDDAGIAALKTKFTAFASKSRLAMPVPGSRSTYGALLKSSGLPQDAQEKFAPIYLKHRGDGAQLWEEARKAGLDGTQVRKLQLQGKLAFLAGNSEVMTTRLLGKAKDPVELVEAGLHDTSAWKTELFEQAGIPQGRRANPTDDDRKKLEALIPATYAAVKFEARLDAYAEDMARKVRLSYPTQVLGRLMETDPHFKLPSGHDATVKLLKNATTQGFRLGETPVSSFLQSRPGVRDGLSEVELHTATEQLKVMQRVYQITPSNEAMPVLMSLGMTSAFDVMAYPEEQFISLFKAKYVKVYGVPAPAGVPELVSRKAKQVSSVTYNLFAIAKKLDSEVPIRAISGTASQHAEAKGKLKEALKAYPTMESLFGSMDYCECEHCRSVLSPAAYQVDLLQFVDAEPAVWRNFLAHWKATHGDKEYPHKNAARDAMKPYDVLIERRPDLPHIALTCENTHTALPYIDIVNEILEYYVANGKLAKEAAHDTGDATTAELLAEPQNVIREAYDTLRVARYPLNLPFDLWIETVRKFCDYFETPLHCVLEVLRVQDDLFAPVRSFDRAAIFMESLGLSPDEVAMFTDAVPLENDKWHDLYGFPSVRAAIQHPTNAGNATLSVANADAEKLRAGLAYTYFDANANVLSAESMILVSIGAPDSGGAGRTTLTLEGVWTVAPDVGDILVCDVPAMLKSAKALSRRLGVTYKEIAGIVQTGFVNPELGKLILLYKLDVSVSDAKLYTDEKAFYEANKDLLGTDRGTLPPVDQQRFDDLAEKRPNREITGWQVVSEVAAFEQRLTSLAAAFEPPLNLNDLRADIQAIPFKSVLVLADPDAGCNFDLTTLQYADGTKADVIVFLRINLFVRLWHKLGWSIEETDRALTTFNPRSAPFDGTAANLAKQPLKTALIYLAHLKALDEKLKVGKQSRLKLLTLWSDIATTGKKPLYAQLFLNRNVLKSAPVFDHPLGQYLTDLNINLKDHVLALQGALGLTADEIGRILSDASKSLDTAKLSLVNVSLLYRYSLLAKALKLPVRELITLKQLSGLDPFKTLHPDPLANLDQDHPFSQTLEFVKVADEVKDSGLKIEDLDYLLRHRFDETGKYRPNREGALALLKSLSEGVRAIRAEHAVLDEPGALSDEVLRQKLGLALAPDVVERFLGMVNTTVEFTATKRSVNAADKFSPPTFAPEERIREISYKEVPHKEQKLTVRGVLFDLAKTAMKASFDAVLTAPQKQAFADLLDGVQMLARDFFDNQLKKQKLRLDGEAGFLEEADFATLFSPLEPLKELLSTDSLAELEFKRGENEKTEKKNQEELQKRRDRIAKAFLPVLQERLIRQFIVQTMTAQTGADPVLVEGFVNDDRLLAAPQALLDVFTATAEHGLNATFWASADATGAALPAVSLLDADTGAKDKAGNPLKPAGADSARLEAYVEVPASGAYRFYIQLDKQNAEAELRFRHLPEPVLVKGKANTGHVTLGDQPNEYVELKAGVLYHISLDLKHLNGGDVRLMVQGETLPKGPLSQLSLYPATVTNAAERAETLLNKALQLVQSLGLSEREIRYLLTHAADFGGVSLSELPTEAVGDTPAEQTATAQRCGRFRRLAAYVRLKRDLAGGTDDLVGIFEANATAAADKLDKKVYPLIATLTRRDETTVKASAEALVKAPAAPAFESEKPLWRLWEVLQIVERFGVPPASLLGWMGIVNSATTADRCFEIARDLKEAIKARFEAETWQRVAQPIFDKLRQRQRDALVSHVMHQHGFERMEQLYEFFLIDLGMEPVVQTSRIRLAISSLQLFIQRCLLNLELKVHPSTINAKQWEWMKRYRVWEANRKIFLFPENWLEPEFRDDKTHLFTELEGALLQGDVSSDLVEDAFLNYLKKLDELARLDICAMHIEDNPDPALRILHVFGRTYSQPHKYFYRRYAHQMWTPWEPVSAEIQGDHLAPVVWRDRLYLFWVTFIEKAEQPVAVSSSPNEPDLVDMKLSGLTSTLMAVAGNRTVEAYLHWSEYLHGEWSAPESSGFNAPSPVLASGLSGFDSKSVFIHVSKKVDNDEESGVYVHLSDPFDVSFYLAGRNSAPERADYGQKPDNLYSSANTEVVNRYSGRDAFTVMFHQLLIFQSNEDPFSSRVPQVILEQARTPGGKYTLLPCNNNLTALGVSEDAYKNAANPDAVKPAIKSGLGEIASLMKPVFYQDNTHTLFVEPSVTERTIEEQNWVTHTPQPEPGWREPDWWKEIVVIPEIPWKSPIPDLGDPWGFSIDPGSLINPTPDRDWLVNPATVLEFEGVLIGPAGQTGMEILLADEVSGTIAEGGTPVNVNPGSGLASGSTVVLSGVTTLEQSGLTQVAGGLNIIGGIGFNSALTQNFNESNRSGFGTGMSGDGRFER